MKMPTACLGAVLGVASAWAATPESTRALPHLQPAHPLVARDGLGNVFAKLEAGKEVRVAYFGGSITAAEGWRPKTLKWLREKYPRATIHEINAAIGGTDSTLGVYRFQRDVLAHKPDLIFVEFGVNDGDNRPKNIWRAMEGIVRQAWTADPSIDLCYVYTFRINHEWTLDIGKCPNAASVHEAVADYYGIPSINMGMTIAEMHRDGKLLFVRPQDASGKTLPVPAGVILFSDDGVHPHDAGQQIYADRITQDLVKIAAASKPGPHALKTPHHADNWQHAKMVAVKPEMLSAGWKKLSTTEGIGKDFAHRMPEIWEASRPGETITFKFKGTGVQFYDVIGPDGGQVICTVDGKPGKLQKLFDEFCTYHRLASLWVARSLEDTVHTVTLEIQPGQPDRREATQQEKPGYDPKKYDGTAVRIGNIMLIGELVE